VERLVSRFKDPVSVSFDGSAFDSNQHFDNIFAVDFSFFDKYRQRLNLIVKTISNHYRLPDKARTEIYQQLIKFYTDPSSDLIVPIHTD